MLSANVTHLIDRLARQVAKLSRDDSAIAAAEFAIIVPIMLVAFFGTVEISSAVAVDRKVTLVARTIADLPSQSSAVNSNDVQNFMAASGAIIWPYDPGPINVTVSQIYIDTNKVARITWSKSATISRTNGQTSAALRISSHNVNDVVALNSALAVPDTYLLWGEVSYNYVPAVGYVMAKTGINLSDVSYSRPRQSKCTSFTEVVGGYTFGTC